MTDLEHQLAHANNSTYELWKSLDIDQKKVAARAFHRHRLACEKARIPIDPHFFRELLDDVQRGLFDVQ